MGMGGGGGGHSTDCPLDLHCVDVALILMYTLNH